MRPRACRNNNLDHVRIIIGTDATFNARLHGENLIVRGLSVTIEARARFSYRATDPRSFISPTLRCILASNYLLRQRGSSLSSSNRRSRRG